MSKSILVIDTPNICIDCPCHFAEETGEVWCGIKDKEILTDDIEEFKPDWCPLKELLEIKAINADPYYVGKTDLYNSGWNACINEILKEVFENPTEYNGDNIGGRD